MNDNPAIVAPAQALLDALRCAPAALALADAAGRLQWCTERFAALLPDPAAPELAALLGGRALAAGVFELPPPHAAWQLQVAAAGAAGWTLSAEALPAQALAAAEARARSLQERLDMVQEYSDTGVFERDAATMAGSWDRHMYRIWGLPAPAAGAADMPAPDYAQVLEMIFSEDRREGDFIASLATPGPHTQRLRMRRRDGQVRHLYTRWKVFHDAQGRPQRVLGTNTDDTDVYELANRAEQLRAELDVALKLGHIALWRHDLASDRIFVDERGCTVLGVPWRAEGMAPAVARTNLHPEDLPLVLNSLKHTLRSGEPSDMELRYRSPDGGWRHVLMRRALQRDGAGQPQGFVGVMLDVTERVEDNRRALASARRLEGAAEAARLGLWATQLDAPLPSWNPRMYALLGLDPQAGPLPLQDWLAQCVHPGDRQRVRASVVDWWRRGPGEAEIEFRIVRPSDGAVRWLVVRGKLDAVGPRLAMRAEGVALDITEQQRTMRQLRETVERMTLTTHALGLGTWTATKGQDGGTWDAQMFRLRGIESVGRRVTDAEIASYLHPDERAEGVAIDTTEQQQTLRRLRETVERMTLASQALGLGTWTAVPGRDGGDWDAQMFRLRGVEAAARHVSTEEIAAFLHPDERSAVMSQQIAWLRDDQPWHHVFRVVWPDGQVRWITSHSVPLRDEQGRVEGRIGVNWDSTEAHLTALAMREREVAVAESQAKSQAMSRISHELRTPLNAMLGFTQLLRAGGAGTDAATRAHWLAHVEDAGQHLLALIDDVLELSRAEVGGLRLERQPVACAAVVDAAWQLVAASAHERGLALQRGPLPGQVLADPVRLRQVLINLLSNAIKYNRPGGTVRLWSQAEGAGERVSLHVADTGLGIAPERLQHAFEPFNRLGAEATGVEGSGIGLSIVKVLVEHMGGQVEARSQPGLGSEFIVHLPAAGPDALAVAPAAQPPAATPAAAPQACVLYIEDNPVNAMLVESILAHRPGITLALAEDGLSGLRRARQLQPDLMLVDMQLPDIDGLAVLRGLRAHPLTAAIRCVALSANATPSDIAAARAAGFIDYWTKPIEVRRFLADIDALLATPH